MHRKMTDQEKKVFASLTKEEKKLLENLGNENATLYLLLNPNQRNAVAGMDLTQRANWFQEFGKKLNWAKEMRKTIKDFIYPAICENGGSIADTKSFISMLEMYVSQASMTYINKVKLEQLDLLKDLDDNYPYKNAVKKIVNQLKGESVADVTSIIGGFNKMIEAIMLKEEQERSFKDLTIDWEKV